MAPEDSEPAKDRQKQRPAARPSIVNSHTTAFAADEVIALDEIAWRISAGALAPQLKLARPETSLYARPSVSED
jgi:hypothetical protein